MDKKADPLPGVILGELQSSLIRLGTQQVMAWLVSQVPFFGWAIVNPIVGGLVGMVVEVLVSRTVLGAKFVYIDHLTQGQADRFDEVARRRLEAKTPEERKALEEELLRRARELIRLPR